jgi:uncharacterized protein (DUF1810 family)
VNDPFRQADPVLGPRLVSCAEAILPAAGRSAEEIFGSIDAIKLRSSMTLFALAAPEQPIFQTVLDEFFGGVPDRATETLLGGWDE